MVTMGIFGLSMCMNMNRRVYQLAFLGLMLCAFLMPIQGMSQECPRFQVSEVQNTVNGDDGKVIVKINGSRRYNQDNFEIRQKENEVTGPIGYEVSMQITSNELVIEGLKKNSELYLKEYVILFSDRACKESEIVEVGTFKIN